MMLRVLVLPYLGVVESSFEKEEPAQAPAAVERVCFRVRVGDLMLFLYRDQTVEQEESRKRGPRKRDLQSMFVSQRKRDDNKNKICTFQGGVGRGAGRKIVQNAVFFHGKRHDNKILKVKMLLSRNFVVMAQAPSIDDAGSILNQEATKDHF